MVSSSREPDIEFYRQGRRCDVRGGLNTSATQGNANVVDITGEDLWRSLSTRRSGTTLVGDRVQWIVERPAVGNTLATLTNYVARPFEYCFAGNATAVTPQVSPSGTIHFRRAHLGADSGVLSLPGTISAKTSVQCNGTNLVNVNFTDTAAVTLTLNNLRIGIPVQIGATNSTGGELGLKIAATSPSGAAFSTIGKASGSYDCRQHRSKPYLLADRLDTPWSGSLFRNLLTETAVE
jgi:hypothetical protein